MIDNLEHKSCKAVLNTMLFYIFGKSCSKYQHFAMFLLWVLGFPPPCPAPKHLFPISKIQKFSIMMMKCFIHLVYLWSLA